MKYKVVIIAVALTALTVALLVNNGRKERERADAKEQADKLERVLEQNRESLK